MSLIGSLLAFVIIPLKAKPKEVDNLAVMALADEVRRLQFALDHWRNAGNALMEENERLREENRRLRQEEAGRQLYVQQQAAMNAQNLAMGQYAQQAGLHGQSLAQYQNQLAWPDCTCVPARARALQQHFHDDLTPGRIWRVDEL